jgi:hypothetical protein
MKHHVVWLQIVLALALTLSVATVAHGQGTPAGSEVYVVQPGDALAAIALRYGVTVDAIAQANAIQDPDLIEVGQELVIPGAVPGDQPVEAVPSSPLAQLPDTDPGPPLAVEVQAVRVMPAPLLESSQRYQVTGIVRNDGVETHFVSRINVTFFDSDGFRGYIARGSKIGDWHGATEAEFACLLLAPGEACPFVAEFTGQDIAAFLVHPDGGATGRQSAPVDLRDVSLSYDGPNIVRISGVASNPNPFAIKNVTVSGVTRDGEGAILAMGSAYVLRAGIGPGETVRFDVRIRNAAFETYQLYAQAERDWN